MMDFNSAEICLSVLYAIIFGFCFFILFSLMNICRDFLRGIIPYLKEAVRFKRIFPLPSFNIYLKEGRSSALFLIISILTFSLGFILLSYLTLDLQLRLYMLVIYFASFYVSYFAFFAFLKSVFLRISGLLLSLVCILLRVVIFPIKLIICKFSQKVLCYFK